MAKPGEIFQNQPDYKALIIKLLRYKYFFLITIVTLLCLAFLFNKFTSPKYTNKTSLVLIKSNNKAFLEDLNKGFEMLLGNEDVEKEMNILTSYSLIYKTILNLNLEVSYYTKENVFSFINLPYKIKKELYKNNSIIEVDFDRTHIQPVDYGIQIKILSDSTFVLKADGENVDLFDYLKNSSIEKLNHLAIQGQYKFGEEITNEYYKFTVYLKNRDQKFEYQNFELTFAFNHLNYLTEIYQKSLDVSTISPKSTFIVISMKGSNAEKITDFLNTLTNVYLQENLKKKNSYAENTISFIDSQIEEISDSLKFTENKLQNFRSDQKVTNLDFQGEKLSENVNDLENQRATLSINQKYYDYILNYLKTNDDFSKLAVPSSMQADDPIINQLISKLTDLSNERLNYYDPNKPKNLFLKDLDNQITNLRNSIMENISYNLNKNKIALQEIDNRLSKYYEQISRLPRTQQQLVGIERKYKLNDEIYTFLLEKRAEAQIATASNAPDYEIIDPAIYYSAEIVYPKKKLDYLIALLLGLFIPFSVVVLKDFFSTRIRDTKDIESITSTPILGQILHNSTKENILIEKYPKSPITDSFRNVRTNLKYFTKGKDNLIILLTSSMPGEGKTFCSLNLAATFSILKKKTIIIDFDLRKPNIYRKIKLDNKLGLSSYFIDDSVTIKNIIQKSEYEYLDFISAGPIPPNPVELIASEKTFELFKNLRELYEVIIVDTAPLGSIPDTYLLFDYADIVIAVVRENYTRKVALLNNLNSIQNKNIKNVSILINDMKIRKRNSNYYYPSKYYYSEQKKSLFKRLIFRRKN